MGSRSPPWEGTVLRRKGCPIVKYRDTAVICTKTAQPIEMPFRLWAWMGQRNCDRWRSRSLHGKGQFSAIGAPIVGTFCHELCRNGWIEPIDLPFGLWTRAGRRKHKFNCICQVAPMFSRGRADWHHLANTIKSSLCGDDAALCQITLKTC